MNTRPPDEIPGILTGIGKINLLLSRLALTIGRSIKKIDGRINFLVDEVNGFTQGRLGKHLDYAFFVFPVS
jgi:hypothetical protein